MDPRRAALCGLLLALASASDAAALTIQRIALEGDAAPDRLGQTFTSFQNARINPSGDVAFSASTTGPVPGIWGAPAGGALRLARNVLTDVALAPDGSVYSNEGDDLWRSVPGGSSQVVAERGAPAPGAGGREFYTIGAAPAASHMSVFATLDLGTGAGLWTHTPSGGLQPRLLTGDTAPGTGGLQFVDLLPHSNPNTDTVAFHGDLTGGLSSLWTLDDTTLQLVAIQGQAAPDVAGATFSHLPDFVNHLASNGDIVFQATLAGAGITSVNDVGVYTSRGGIVELLIQGGDPLPGVSRNFARPIETLMTASGRVALEAAFFNQLQTNEAGNGLWRTDAAGVLKRIASENGVVPGLPSTIRYGGSYELFQNDAGWLLFENSLVGAPNGTQETLFLLSPEDELEILLRAGDLFAAGPGLDLVISNIAVGGMNNAGEIIVDLAFTNGLEGVYVLDLELPDAPEPALAALAPGALGVLALRRRRRV